MAKAKKSKKATSIMAVINLILIFITYGAWLVVLAIWYWVIPALTKKNAAPPMSGNIAAQAERVSGEFYSKVAGVSFNNTDGTSRQKIIERFARAGMPLILVREPNNPHSENRTAVAVFIKAQRLFSMRHEQIGYLNEHVSEEISRHIDSGKLVTAKISEVTGGGQGRSFGVNIFIKKH